MQRASSLARICFAGFIAPALQAALADAAASPTQSKVAETTILLAAGPEAIASARGFADAVPHGLEALIVILLGNAPPDLDAAARLWAFTRQAALDWAPRRIRVNVIALGADPLLPANPLRPARQPDPAGVPEAEIAATISLMWRLASMTGQFIRLGPP